jgi:hypothetical protein
MPPVLDAACAVALAIPTVGLFKVASDCLSPGLCQLGGVLLGVPAVLCGISGVSGAKKASSCAKLKGANAACIGGDHAACQRLKPGWQAPVGVPLVPDAHRSSDPG